MPIKTFLEGNAWCATFDNFTDLMECPAGFGNTKEDAIEALLKDSLKRANVILQEIKPAQTYADDLIARVKECCIESQNGVECDVAKISYKPAYTQIGYDKKALDKYAEEHPEIEKFKKVTEYKASAALKWRETI